MTTAHDRLLGIKYNPANAKVFVWLFCLQKYKEFERAVRVEEIDGLRLVKRLAEDMEEMFHKKAQAMKVLPRWG